MRKVDQRILAYLASHGPSRGLHIGREVAWMLLPIYVRLHDLEEKGLVTSEVTAESSPHRLYRITDKGAETTNP